MGLNPFLTSCGTILNTCAKMHIVVKMDVKEKKTAVTLRVLCCCSSFRSDSSFSIDDDDQSLGEFSVNTRKVESVSVSTVGPH